MKDFINSFHGDMLSGIILSRDPLYIYGCRHLFNQSGIVRIQGAYTTDKNLMKACALKEPNFIIILPDFFKNIDDLLTMVSEIQARTAVEFILLLSPEANVNVDSEKVFYFTYDINTSFTSILTSVLSVVMKKKQDRVMHHNQGALLTRKKIIHVLSQNEKVVILEVLKGKSVSEIALNMGKSLKTISGQKQSALRRLGIKNDYELFRAFER